MILIQILPIFSIFVISISSISYNVIRRDLHCDRKTSLEKVTLRGANVMSYRKWRQVHVAAQVLFMAIIIIAAPIELAFICYYRGYLECSSWVEPVDRMLVLPLLATGHVSGLAMIAPNVKSMKEVDPILEQVMWLFNSFGFFWVLIDLSMRNGVLLSDPGNIIHLDNPNERDFPTVLFTVRLFTNVVSLGFIYALKDKMNNLSKSMKRNVTRME